MIKQRIYRSFLETRQAQNLRDLPETETLQVHPLAQGRDQDVDTHGDPHLGLHRIFGGTEERFDVQVLLHPFEEQFDLPPRLVESGDDMRWQHEVVGNEDQCFLSLRIAESNTTKAFWVGSDCLHAVSLDDPVRSHTCGFINRLGLDATQQQRRFWTRDEERACQMEAVKSFQILITPIHDVVCTWFGSENIQRVDIVDFTVGYVDEGRYGATQVDQRMQLHGGLGPAELGPRKQFQAKIDGRRIESKDCLLQIRNGCVLGVQISRLGDQHLGEIGEDSPISLLVRIGQGCARNGSANPKVVELGRNGAKAGLDIAQTLPAGQLGKSHAQELVQVGEGSRGASIRISLSASMEISQGQEVHDLREHQPTCMHVTPCQGAESPPEGHSPVKSFHFPPCILHG